ncbi:Retrovirus-related Pol polyprotein from transposon RE1 [Vitis vinifera]|uniref:Retrovirus-related Pol polyprotein from transposon RE1 n=2 Tax=Vitis vinifera TaxID=29760 RepID=A0A438H8I0_VITVI|nr:Retrovirus-related Pol polyprotein from transposon RE1 [Vitis vinifera]
MSVGTSLETTHRRRNFRAIPRRTFPATYFSDTDHTRRSAWRRSPTFVKAPAPKEDPRAGHAPFSGRRLHLTRRRVRAREALSGDAPPPPASPAADQHPYLPGSPIRALHVPLLGIFVSVSPPNSLSGEVPATFSPPQSLHVPWEVFFYLFGVKIIFPGLPLLNFGLWVKDMRITWLPRRQISLRPKDYTRMISSVFIRWLLLLSISANRTWIYLLILLDKFFMVLTLIGLRPDLEPIRDQILGSSSVPSLDDVFARLLCISSTQTLPSDSASDSSVLISQTTSRGGCSGTRGRGQRPHCTIAINLATLAIVAISYMEDLLALPIWPRPLILRCLSLRAPPHLRHLRLLLPLLPSLDLFSSITTTSDLPTVTLANGSQTVAKGIGLALPLPSLPLTSVLYTPECPFNLISISKITRTLNCSITFSDKFVTLQDRSTGKTIGIGRESQGLYHLTQIHLLQFAFPLMLLSSFTIVWATLVSPSSRRWFLVFPLCRRFRVSHVSLGKHTRVSFPKRLNNRAKSPFELVHTDVWGPCRTASTLGFQYFVTFIDDYSRLTMPGEYFSAQFTSFMSHHGILHQSSCAHTPQQNGVAERKNRHLVETARTLLLHSHVPFRFWGDAVLTACYLINRMPSSVLHDQIPHSLLFPDQPLYFLPPRVFGCTCFVHILTPGQDKPFRQSHEDSPFFSTTSESLPVSEVLPIPIVSPPDAMPPRPLQVYHCRPRVVAPLTFPEAPADSLPIPSASPAPALPSPNDLPIAVRKGWRQAMVDEMAALHSNDTWDLVVLPSGKSTVGCRWVYAVKVGPDGQVDRLKARLVAKGYTQVYGSDYGDTFSPVVKIAFVRLLLSMAAMCSWPLYQLDIKNAFLHGDLARKFIWSNLLVLLLQGESGLVCRLRRSLYGLKQSPRAWFSRFSSVVQGVWHASQYSRPFSFFIIITPWGSTKDLGKLKYFLGIEIAQSSSGVVLSQRKYALDILEETGQGEPLGDPGRYRRLVGKLNYLTITRPDIFFSLHQAKVYCTRTEVILKLLVTQMQIGLGSPTDRRSTSGYYIFIGGNLISWKSKKQDVVARSSAEAEYRAMALATCELIWLRHLLQELRFGKDEQMKLICDNQAALHIASNPVFHERTKHIEVDCHFIREKIASGCVATSFVNSNDQLADIFTKSLRGPRIKYICNKLGAYDVYTPA